MSRRSLVQRVPFFLGLLILTLISGLTLLSVWYTPYNPETMDIRNRLMAPSREHLFGTDMYGRDVFSRVVTGGQAALLVCGGAVFLGMVLGSLLGMLAGYFGGYLDLFLTRLADGMYAFPGILLALLAVTIYGPGKTTVLFAIAIANVPVFLRLSRTLFLTLKQKPFVEAARALGATSPRILFWHLLPNASSPLLVQGAVSIGLALLAEASLGYLGVGIQPPEPSWGRMLKEAQSFVSFAPWLVVFPFSFLALTVLGFNLVADGFQRKR